MALPVKAPGEEVQSEDHNSLSQLLNGVSGYGQPVKLHQFNSASVYSATFGNQDTTNGLIAAFQYGDPAGTPVTVMQINKAGLTLTALPLRVAGGATPAYGGLSVTSTGEVLMGDIAASMAGPGNAQFTMNYIQPAGGNASSRVASLIDSTIRAGDATFGVDSSVSQFVMASGKVANRDTSPYTPTSPGPSVTRCVDIRVLDSSWAGIINAPNTHNRWGVSVGYENITATHDDTGAHANEKVAFIALSDGNAFTSPQFVDSPTSNGTRPNCAYYAGGGGGASYPAGGTYASATTCAFEWPFFAAGTSNTAGIFCVYQDGRTGIAMVPLIATRSGMLQVNQDGNHDAGSGFRLWKNASTTNYASLFNDTNTTLNLAVRGSGLAGADLLLAASASLDALTLKVATAQVFSVDTAGIPNWVTANSGTGAGGAAATLGNVSASAATGPTTAAATEWVKVKINGNQRWIRAWT